MSETLKTSDIWMRAFLLCETNAQLDAVEIKRKKREVVIFSFSGSNLASKARDYRKHEALANVVELRCKLNFLKDIIFQSRKRRLVDE